MKQNYTDIHCHILPGIDDGAGVSQQSIRMLRESVRQDVTQFCFTPHFYPERQKTEEFLFERQSSVARLESKLASSGLDIQYRVGAEVHVTPDLPEYPLESLCIAGTPYILIELWTEYEPLGVREVIRRIREQGFIPILAHVERYPYVEKNPVKLYEWISAGALGQINAGSMLESHSMKKRLEMYYQWNLVHVMATDTHSLRHRPPNMAEGMRAIPQEMAKSFHENANAIFEGEKIRKKRPVKPEKGLFGWH